MTDAVSNATDFRFEYGPPTLLFGRGKVADLGAELERQGLERALVVCGSTVGSTPAVIDPVREGLGDRLGDVFAETTPEKRLGTAYDGVDALRAAGADAVVSLGGGSSLDTAKAISLLAADDREPAAVGREFEATGTIGVPDGGLVPIVAVPTTLAGADLSMGAGLTASPDSGLVASETAGGIGDPKLMPAAVCYDPDLLATTPRDVLAASAMNGFDKGIETLYARTATPVTDATAARGLGRFREGLLAFGRGDGSPSTYEALAEGVMLVQYGISRPDAGTLALIHAFGHGLTRGYPVQQGAAHATVAPHVLRYLFGEVDGRRDLLAEALGVGDAADPAAAVVDAVAEVRDALELPARIRDVDGPTPGAFPDVAQVVLDDAFTANSPPGLEPTVEEIEAVLEAAW